MEGLRGVSLPLVKTLGAPVLIGVAGTVLVVPISTCRVVGKSGLVRRLSLPLVKTLGAPVLIRVAGTVLVVSVATSGVVGKSGLVVGLRGISLPLVKTLGGPVGVGVTGTVLVVSVSTSGVVGKSRLVRGLSLPLVVATTITIAGGINLVPLYVLVAIIGVNTVGVAVGGAVAGLSLPLVKTLGAPVLIGVSGTVLV